MNACLAAGLPHRPPRADEYGQLQWCLTHYLETTYEGKFNVHERSAMVLEALSEFIPCLHVRMVRPISALPDPDDILQWLDNTALDRLYPAEPSVIERREVTERVSVADDEALTRRLLRTDPRTVRAEMRALATEGQFLDFLIMTQYLDLGALDMTQPPKATDVAAKLRGHSIGAGFLITDLDVSSAVVRFRSRISRWA